MKFTLPKGSLCDIQFDNDSLVLTEHGRGDVNITPEELKTPIRLANGKMVKYSLGFKNTFSFTWQMLPGLDENTVDGKAGRDRLADAVRNNTGTAVLRIKSHNDVGEEYTDTYVVFVETYQEVLIRRWATDQFWNVTLNLVEQ